VNGREDVDYKPFARLNDSNADLLQACDVAIEFTTPEAAPTVIRQCIGLGKPVISGTTGWHEYHLSEILQLCRQRKGKFLYASNFSIGMNIVFALNARLVELLRPYPEFHPALREIHHIHKKDAPSGTAFTLVEEIIKNRPQYTGINLNNQQADTRNQLVPVEAIREGEVKGFHEITWNSRDEKIRLSHEAMDRSIFAAGAIVAALWLTEQKEGIYTMRDVIGV
jgi:4-hydroxy-tetrahydrodipicolinate reductase